MRYTLNSESDTLVPTNDCYIVFFTDISIVHDCISMFAANRCMFLVSSV